MSAGSTRVLSFHAGYRCRQRGACCAAGWPVPVEADQLPVLRRAVTKGELRPRVGDEAFETTGNASPNTPVLLARPDGRCLFFDEAGGASCRVHSSLGHGALPLACRQFPRVTVRDPRGASVTLSHYCPTAAEMLDASGPVSVVINAAGFRANGEYVGLDATIGVPPLLRPDMAMDWDSWWEWERLSLGVLAADHMTIDASLAHLRGASEHLRTWTPAAGPLIEAVSRSLGGTAPIARAVDVDARIEEVRLAIPEGLRPPPGWPAGAEPQSAHVHRRFLAAHAFASWTAHLGLGLRTWLRSVEAAHALLVSGRGVGGSDLWLRHLVDPHDVAKTWSEAERG
jgi:Fe-S-cluster containining protein